MLKTVVSGKGQIVIPKEVREKVGLTKGTTLKVWVEGKRIILEPAAEPPTEIFVKAGKNVTEQILSEAKTTSSKNLKLLRDLGVPID